MIGPTIQSIGLLINKWWWRIFFTVVIGYSIWFFATAVDAHLKCQMNLWSRNLGM